MITEIKEKELSTMAKKKNKKPMQIKETAEQRAERLASGFKPTTRIIPNKKKKVESRKVKHKKALLYA